MKEDQYQIIISHIGIHLLRYILNKEDITNNQRFSELDLSDEQKSVLTDLYTKIQQLRLLHVMEDCLWDSINPELSILCFQGDSVYNYYRERCGGSFLESKWKSDPLLEYIYQITKINYPKLLYKDSLKKSYRFDNNELFGMPQMVAFSDLVRSDVLNELTNKKEGLEYQFNFTTNLGKIIIQVSVALGTIILRSFANCCNELKFGLEDLMTEIENNINKLRALTQNKEVIFSSYVGIKGLALVDFTNFHHSNFSLFQLSSENLSLLNQKLIVGYDINGKSYTSGCILKINHIVKIIDININTSGEGYSRKTREEQDKILKVFKFTLVFTLKEDRGIVPINFETGFPLVLVGNGHFSDKDFSKLIKLENSHCEELKTWYDKLLKVDFKDIQTTINRLEYAIFERKSPEDAIIDAIIAWEGMFSEAFETTFKVTGSIAKYLIEDLKERAIFLAKLKQLYDLRSILVHGKNSKNDLRKSNEIEDLRSEVIKIGLDCLAKLLDDEETLKLTPSERIKKILVLN